MFLEELKKLNDPLPEKLILGQDLNWTSLNCKSGALPLPSIVNALLKYLVLGPLSECEK
jgi:hypothetical protein